jgi:hypothetical protein
MLQEPRDVLPRRAAVHQCTLPSVGANGVSAAWPRGHSSSIHPSGSSPQERQTRSTRGYWYLLVRAHDAASSIGPPAAAPPLQTASTRAESSRAKVLGGGGAVGESSRVDFATSAQAADGLERGPPRQTRFNRLPVEGSAGAGANSVRTIARLNRVHSAIPQTTAAAAARRRENRYCDGRAPPKQQMAWSLRKVSNPTLPWSQRR